MGVAVGDYHNDGRPDLYVTNFGVPRLIKMAAAINNNYLKNIKNLKSESNHQLHDPSSWPDQACAGDAVTRSNTASR